MPQGLRGDSPSVLCILTGTAWEDLEPVRGGLVELVQELLPDDPVIRGLKKAR